MAQSVYELETFINLNGFPMLRRCENCIFFNQKSDKPNKNLDYEAQLEELRLGYCTFKLFHFAFTLEPNLYPLVKYFYLCENHKFFNEEKLELVCEKIMLTSAMKKKEEIL